MEGLQLVHDVGENFVADEAETADDVEPSIDLCGGKAIVFPVVVELRQATQATEYDSATLECGKKVLVN